MAEKRFVYADNAATSPLSPKALEAMMPYLQSNYANASQPYSFARAVRKALSQSRKIIAECINASPEEIYFTSGGSESNNWVMNGAIDFGMDIVTSAIEHHSILRPAQYAAENGCNLAYIPVSETGIVELPELYSRIQNPGSLISIMLANNEIGTVQHIAELSQLSHDAKCIFHTDAVQALGHVKVDVQTLGIDMLSGSAHKFNGPKGIGFLYVRKGMKWPAFIKGGSQEFGFRSGTENIAAIVGMATALEENVSSMEDNASVLNEIECKFLYELTIRGIKFHRNGDSRHIPGNISLSFNNYEGEMLLHRLDLKGVMISTGSACDSKETQVSHVLKAIGLSEENAKGTIRISFGHQNSIADAKYIAEAITSIVSPSYSQANNSDYRNNKLRSDIPVIEDVSPIREIEDYRPSKITCVNKPFSMPNGTTVGENIENATDISIPSKGQFYIRTIGCNAEARLISNGKIVILKGSILRVDATPRFDRKKFRQKIIDQYCTLTPDGYLVNEDLPPMSPSGASGLVQARSSNGKRDWLDKEGKPLSTYL